MIISSFQSLCFKMVLNDMLLMEGIWAYSKLVHNKQKLSQILKATKIHSVRKNLEILLQPMMRAQRFLPTFTSQQPCVFLYRSQVQVYSINDATAKLIKNINTILNIYYTKSLMLCPCSLAFKHPMGHLKEQEFIMTILVKMKTTILYQAASGGTNKDLDGRFTALCF